MTRYEIAFHAISNKSFWSSLFHNIVGKMPDPLKAALRSKVRNRLAECEAEPHEKSLLILLCPSPSGTKGAGGSKYIKNITYAGERILSLLIKEEYL